MVYYFQGFVCGLVPAAIVAVLLIFKKTLTAVVWE